MGQLYVREVIAKAAMSFVRVRLFGVVGRGSRLDPGLRRVSGLASGFAWADFLS